MASIFKVYWRESRTCFSRLPVWLPGTPMALGDIGVLSEHGWTKVTRLTDLRIAVTVDEVGPPSDYDYSSGATISQETALFGQTTHEYAGLASGSAGLVVDFHRGGAFILKADAVRVCRIDNLNEIEAAILDLYSRGMWLREWVVVTEVARGGPSVTLIAEDAGAKAAVGLSAGVASGGADPTGVHGGLRLGYQRGLAASFITSETSAVLWRGRYVNDGWFGRTAVRERGDDSGVRRAAWSHPATETFAEKQPYLMDIEDVDEVLDSLRF